MAGETEAVIFEGLENAARPFRYAHLAGSF
jgi:hypothetical protein